MEKNYTYPHVNITTRALKHSNAVAEAPDTTVLFVPLYTEKGPINEIRRVHTLGEFIEIYGELTYKINGQSALNVYNWLSNGGTVYAFRLVPTGTTKREIKVNDEKVGEFKYPGTKYNSYTIRIKCKSAVKFDLFVEDSKNKIVEAFYNKTKKNINDALRASDYIESLDMENIDIALNNDPSFTYEDATGDETITQDSLLKLFWTEDTGAKSILENHLETPIDLILDAGYSKEVKEAIAKFIAGDSAIRSDIIGIFDNYTGFNKLDAPTKVEIEFPNASNIAVYDQYMLIEDATFTNQEIYVSPTYFLSKLIPENDSIYGIQFPTAGLKRGILEDAKQLLGTKPTADQKQAWFESRVNYAEATPREIAFMNQRTHDGSTEDDYTALSFLHASRCVKKMKKDIERLGRNYLFEFNDSITLAQMSSVLNKYISEWVSNRTLSYALIEVSQNPYSDEAVDVVMNIKFTGTIEIISVDITIQ